MKTRSLVVCCALAPCLLIMSQGCNRATGKQSTEALNTSPHVVASAPVAAGRYLVLVAGCNDCHTEGYMQDASKVSESDWLTGSAVGWRGPWGTTYPSNLRLLAQDIGEDDWVTMLHTRQTLPPMPWANVNHLSEADARAVYRYLRAAGPKGQPAPKALPPDKTPTTPWLDMRPNLPESAPPAE